MTYIFVSEKIFFLNSFFPKNERSREHRTVWVCLCRS